MWLDRESKAAFPLWCRAASTARNKISKSILGGAMRMCEDSFNKKSHQKLDISAHLTIFQSRRAQNYWEMCQNLTCMFHVLGRCTDDADDFCPFACFVCCIIWLIKSSCWRVNPSLLVPAGELGDGDFELIAVIVFPSAFIWYWMQVAPCGELASPN